MIKKLISILLAIFFLNNCIFSQPEQKEIIKEADLLLDMMEYKAAIMNYLKVISENPQQRDIRKNIGYAYFQLDKIDEALKDGNYFLDAYNSLGTIYFKKKEFKKSILAFKKVVEIYPEETKSTLNEFMK